MSFLKRLPWTSLGLLLAAYSTLGWVLFAAYAPWYAWVVIVVGIFLLVGYLTASWLNIRDSIGLLFQSDARAFVVAVTVAFLSVVMIAWFHLFAHALLLVCAVILARLDAETLGWRDRKAFWILFIVCMVGLVLGAVGQGLIYSPSN